MYVRILSRWLMLAGFVLSAAVLGGCKHQAEAAAEQAAAEVTVVTLKPQPVTIRRELPGRTTAYLIAEVRPQVNGIVKQRLFTEGALVQAGQPLYQIDDATYRAEYGSAKANLAKAQAALASTSLNAQRSAELVKTHVLSKQDNDNVHATWKQAEADVAAAQAALQSSSVVLGFARIVAPISGRIGKSNVTQGALVTANQANALATVQQIDPLYVDITQSSNEMLQLRRQLADGALKTTEDAPVKIMLEDGSSYAHEGRLQFAEVTVDPSTGSFSLRVVVPNPDGLLLPGMYVRAVLDKGVNPSGLLVPQQGITRDPKGDAVAMVIGKDNKAEQRKVHVSHTLGNQWLVQDGLAPGDQVIVEGLQKIQPGVPVHATEASVATASTAPHGA
ncbi:efflux RND transporter periplasmic adaptor subunit [Dyella silvatica]|uniref:efflux RND transporter periplasmic adaptor subunit n=1 Tax=Dyella silvatica TaxID=2992128 RepID=UPI00224FCDF0|nr:efflux RND transporter periplasmic adaptor subunit [Dyella silvatica]